MASNVFLSSVFKGLHEIRHKIWMDIQKFENLHCISFQSDHVTHYPKSILADTVSEIEKCDFFVFLVGPEYGTVIDSVLKADDMNGVNGYENLSFSHFEFECARKKLTELPEEKKPKERFFYAILKNYQADQNVNANLTDYVLSISTFKNLGGACKFFIKQKKTNGQQESYEIDNSSMLFSSLAKCLKEWNKIAEAEERRKYLKKSIKV
ncbi:MAG: DUF4062 domain-containing protein, partial [Desulfobulbaceae bacterium]|nr:DUF4062 domain-containing protein [Desulfobulbaceae bacterium]